MRQFRLFAEVTVCLSYDYDITPLPIFMHFGINGLGTKVEQRIRVCKDFKFLSRFKMVAVFLDIFRSYGRRARSTVYITTLMISLTWLKSYLLQSYIQISGSAVD